MNETVFENVDLIHGAMFRNRQICFVYCEWNVKKKLVPRRDGKIYEISPWSLTWNDENYYLVGYDEESDKIKHYRVDKMRDMKISGRKRAGKENFRHFDLAAFAKKTFGMYGGEDVTVTLQCDNRLIGVVIDRFGRDIMVMPAGEDQFRAHVMVAVSPQFFGWVTGIGRGMQIAGPERVRDAYKEYLTGVTAAYK